MARWDGMSSERGGRSEVRSELAEAEWVSLSHFSRILRPTLPAPEIVEGILEGRDQADLAQ